MQLNQLFFYLHLLMKRTNFWMLPLFTFTANVPHFLRCLSFYWRWTWQPGLNVHWKGFLLLSVKSNIACLQQSNNFLRGRDAYRRLPWFLCSAHIGPVHEGRTQIFMFAEEASQVLEKLFVSLKHERHEQLFMSFMNDMLKRNVLSNVATLRKVTLIQT